MLDNEPNENTTAAETAVTAPASSAPARKATRKRTTKKAAAQGAPADQPAQAAVSTESDAAAADPAPAAAKRAAAKRTVKKAVAKRPAKKTAAKKVAAGQDTLPDSAAETPDSPEPPAVTEAAPAAAKKTSRRRSSKKAAAAPQPDLLTPDTAVTDGPVADAELTPEEEEAAAALAAEAAAVEAAALAAAAEASADGSQRRTRRRAPAAAAVLFQAPVDVPAKAAATSSVEAASDTSTSNSTPETRTSNRRTAGSRTSGNRTPETTAPEAEVTAKAEADADEQPTGTRRRRSRRSRDAEDVATDRSEQVLEEAKQTSGQRGGQQVAAKQTGGQQTGGQQVAGKQDAGQQDAEDDTIETDAETDEVDGDEGGEGTRRRRRRRGGRRRRKAGDGSEDSADEQSEDENEDEHDDHEDSDGSDDQSESDDETEGSGSSSRRRRRRRRRKGEDSSSAPDDPEEIVVRVREPRSKTISNEITAVEGSTRLEAKKQRRREGRAAGRRRAPIVTEAEFLARRESVERTMVIRARGDLTQIAVSEDNVLVEHYVAQEEQVSLIGNVYLGRVQNVLPSMEAAFIDIGKGRNAVLYAGEVDWATLGGGNGPRKIESVLKSGQAVLVQVTKDPIGHKGARLTNQISLPGRYVVYVPRGGNGGISRKLPDTERNRLKGILKDIVPDEAGVIVRTAAEGATEDELTADVKRLQTYWEDIDKLSKSGQAPQLLHGEPDLLIRVVRDLFTEDFTKLVISGDEAYDQVKEYVSDVAPHLADRVEKWTADGDVFANFRIDEQIKKALDRKVWLPSGGSLIIDRTEAMTVVDVNTGKFTGSGGNLEETVTKNNLEAAEEIVRQLRLRDIGGIIVIDFIDMVLELNRDLVLRRLVECLGRDRTKHQVAEVTSLGLVQMTRKRIGTGLLEAFSENCDHCGGRGIILHDEPKESKRRQDDGRGRGQGGQQNQNEQKSGDGEGASKKSSRSRNRGKGRGRGEGGDEQPEAEQNNDAAEKLAKIAAASQLAGGEPAASHPEVTAEASQGDSQATEARGDSQAGQQDSQAAEGQSEQESAGQNGTGRNGSTRRRRNSRSRSTASSNEGDAGNSGADASVGAQELASTPV